MRKSNIYEYTKFEYIIEKQRIKFKSTNRHICQFTVHKSQFTEMQLTYIYHSCFVAETDSAIVVFDYWRDTSDCRLARLLNSCDKQVYFVVSHFHEDHYNPDIVSWKCGGSAPRLLLSYDTVKRHHINKALPCAILHPGDTYADEHLSLKAYRSTDVGVSTFVAFPDGTTLFHAGDLNNWFFPIDDNEHLKVTPQEMEGMFISIVRNIYADHKHIDHVMFPVDCRLGREAVRGPVQWLSTIDTQYFHPMHFWDDAEALAKNILSLKSLFPEVTINY